MMNSRLTVISLKSAVLLCILVVLLAVQALLSEIADEIAPDASSCQLSPQEPQSGRDSGHCSRSPLVRPHSRATRKEEFFIDYYEEQAEGFELRVLEKSFDERLANIIYTINPHKVFEKDSFHFNLGDHESNSEIMRAVAGPEVSESECHKHLSQMVSLLDEMNHRLDSKRSGRTEELHFDERHFRLARVLDSFGRYEPGFMSGRTQSVGQFDQCVSSKLLLGQDSPPQKVDTRFCWARLDATKHLNSALKNSLRGEFGLARGRILAGACLPKSCHSRTLIKNINKDSHQLVQKLVNSQFKLPTSIYLDENLEVDSIFCLVDRDSPHWNLPLSSKLILLLLVAWLLVTIYASIYTASSQQAGRKESTSLLGSVMDCLDIRQSIYEFLGFSKSPLSAAELEKQELRSRSRRVDLAALDSVKVFGCCFVVFCHSLTLRLSHGQNPLRAAHLLMRDPVSLLVVMGGTIVDTFFIITGIRLGYSQMLRASRTAVAQRVESQSPSNKIKPLTDVGGNLARTAETGANQNRPMQFLRQWISFSLNRYLVLMPLLYLIFWLQKSIFIGSLGDQPLWDAGFNRDTTAGACRHESWFSPLLMAAAFVTLNKQCLPQTWSVANDLFFSLVIPPVLLLMPRRPKLALCVGVVMALTSSALGAGAYQAVDPLMKKAFDEMRFESYSMLFGTLHHLYTYPTYRLGTILVGVLAGYFLFKYEEEKFEWPAWFRRPATRGALVGMLLIPLFISQSYWRPFIHPYECVFPVVMFCGFRLILPASYAILLMRMATDWRHKFLMKFCTGQFWRSMARLNYAILLIHVGVLIQLAFSGSELIHYSKELVLADFAAAYFCCIPLAMFLHIVYENPFGKLAKRHLAPFLGR